MGKFKTKDIQTNLGTFRYNQTYPGIIQAYSKLYVTLAYIEEGAYWHTGTFTILVHLESLYIQNVGIFKI